MSWEDRTMALARYIHQTYDFPAELMLRICKASTKQPDEVLGVLQLELTRITLNADQPLPEQFAGQALAEQIEISYFGKQASKLSGSLGTPMDSGDVGKWLVSQLGSKRVQLLDSHGRRIE